ncbi:BolA family protein [Terrarubrum flagellatum]|uniref:BolA family protein n=1 Tax=Terrirubrum flagellatum TaxID=2895980 RepID=UPI003144EBDD
MNRQNRIAAALRDGLAPSALEVIDESHQHAGHAGARPGGETHYRVHVISEAFTGKSRVDRHRMVNALLKPEFAGGLHALAIHAKATGE